MLTVRITGRCGEGKSTIAAIVEKALKDHGIEVRNNDPDVLYQTHYPEHQEKRVAAIAKRTKAESILIETVQLRRTEEEGL